MRGGDRGPDGYGPSGVGSNKGPGATSGGIGNTGVGWSGSGHQSRASAASRGARGIGGGGYGSNRGSGSKAGAGRRAAALESFGVPGRAALSELGLGGFLGGLTRGLANSLGMGRNTGMEQSAEESARGFASDMVDKAVGLAPTSNPNKGRLSPEWGTPDVGVTVGEFGPYGVHNAPYGSPAAQEQAERAQGAKAAIGRTGIEGVPGVGGLLGWGMDALAKTNMTKAAQVGYRGARKDVSSAKTQATQKGMSVLGIPHFVAQTLVTGLNVKNVSERARDVYGVDLSSVQKGRRSQAVAAFGNNRKPTNDVLYPSSQYELLKRNWEPASYGVGEYGSHIKGLLS